MPRSIVLAALGVLGVGACHPADQVPAGSNRTGMRLSVDYYGDTDVVGFHFSVARRACTPGEPFEPWHATANVNLVDAIFPGMMQFISQHPLDTESNHLGADLFLSLAPGCYDVRAVPASHLDEDSFVASRDCSTAIAEGLQVDAGKTTEAILLSQCVGDENGADRKSVV